VFRGSSTFSELGGDAGGKLADLLVLAEDPRADARAFRALMGVMHGGKLHPQALAQRK